MPKPSFPANAEGLSKLSRRSVLFGAGAVCVSAAIPDVVPAETQREEFRRLFNQLSTDKKQDFLKFMRHLSDPENYPMWTGPAFYEVFENDKLICCWIDRVWCEKERDLVYECRIYWDGYLMSPSERFRKDDLLIVRKLTDLQLRKPQIDRSTDL